MPTVSNKLLLLVLALVIVGVATVLAFQWEGEEGKDKVPGEKRSTIVAPENATGGKNDTAQTSETKDRHSDVGTSTGTQNRLVQEAQRVSRQSEDLEPAASGYAVVASPDDADPQSVIGRPFPILESIKSECRQDVKRYGRKDAGCVWELAELTLMEREPRDVAWAGPMEARLRFVLQSYFSEYKIEALECRTTLCAVNLTSMEKSILGGNVIRSDEWLRSRLIDASWLDAFEYDAVKGRIYVDHRMFYRWPNPNWQRHLDDVQRLSEELSR